MSQEYVEMREGGCYVAGSLVDESLAARRSDVEAKRQAARDADPIFYQKIAAARRTPIAS